MINYKNSTIKNIYYMLSYAYQCLQQQNYEEIITESFENVADLFAAILAKGIIIQLKHGLSREYILESGKLSVLRGKIDLKESLQLKIHNDHRLACSYDELSENHYMNQILKSAALCLIYNGGVERKNKDALKKSILFFSKVDTLEPSTINWHNLHYNHTNASYRMLINICYLLLHDLLLTTEAGKHKLATFLDDQKMSRLYEKFILEYCKKHFPQYHPAAKEIRWNTTGTIDFLPKMQSDVILFNIEKKKKLIIDAKFYGRIMQTQYDTDTIRSNHLYQIFTYVKNEDKDNTGLVDGMLLYAKTDDVKITNSVYNLGGNRIIVKTLDLGRDFVDIKSQLDSFVDEWNER
jgi:5-methylcytosine-specific restriction enzyme subunit McrC